MGFRAGAYAKVWEVKAGNGNYTDARISISKKNRQTEQYETDFSGFVRLIGNAHQKAGSIKEGSRIKLGDCEVTNSYNKEKKITYTNYAVFDFESADSNSNNASSGATNSAAKPNDFVNIPDGLEEELPFA